MGNEKIIVIPYSCPTYMQYTYVKELSKHFFEEQRHFLSVYKQLENKETLVKEFGGIIEAVAVIKRAIENYTDKFIYIEKSEVRV